MQSKSVLAKAAATRDFLHISESVEDDPKNGPQTSRSSPLEGKDKKACQKLFEALDENDAVQDIYSNLKT